MRFKIIKIHRREARGGGGGGGDGGVVRLLALRPSRASLCGAGAAVRWRCGRGVRRTAAPAWQCSVSVAGGRGGVGAWEAQGSAR